MNRVWWLNTSPILTLSSAGYIWILDALEIDFRIPLAVRTEIERWAEIDSARVWATSLPAERLAEATEIESRIAEEKLGAGESAVLSHAMKSEAAIAVVDDGAARACAKRLGIAYTGTAGLILRARERKIIPALKPVVLELQRVGAYFSNSLLARLYEIEKGIDD